MSSYIFKLSSVAKRSGGDKYSADLGDEKPTDIYIPQVISRNGSSKPRDEIKVTISEQELNGSYNVNIDKIAKSKGGDKYTGEIEEQSFTVYLPQVLSRKNRKEPIGEFHFLFENVRTSTKSNKTKILKYFENVVDLADEDLLDKFIKQIDENCFIEYIKNLLSEDEKEDEFYETSEEEE